MARESLTHARPRRATPLRVAITRALLVATLGTLLLTATASARATAGQVVVPRGGSVQIAVVLDKSDSVGATYYAGIHNAIRMAVQYRTPRSAASVSHSTTASTRRASETPRSPTTSPPRRPSSPTRRTSA